MSKALDVVMAGIIAGIVAYATSILGIGGTIIGAVIGAILYQIMSHMFKAPLEGIKTQKVETRIVYIFPLILILIIEIFYILALLYLKPGNLFYILENATSDNLFRSIGVGLIIMGIYPILVHENIKKTYGYIIIAVGIVKLLAGFADFNVPITDLYAFIFSELGIIIALIVIVALGYVIISITRESVTIINEKNDIDNKKSNDEVKYGERIDHWYEGNDDGNDPKIKADDDKRQL
ncbi:MAG: hypothetical protein LLF83_11765 [Methanobacterium sp.]|nr:hypothetical protein [Methanobacterium sp.]